MTRFSYRDMMVMLMIGTAMGGLTVFVMMRPAHGFGPTPLSSNIPVNMLICDGTVSQQSCGLVTVGPQGVTFQSYKFQTIIFAPEEIQWQSAGYFFNHWENGSTNWTRVQSNFPRNQTLSATYSPVHTANNDALLLAVALLLGTVSTFAVIREARRKRQVKLTR